MTIGSPSERASERRPIGIEPSPAASSASNCDSGGMSRPSTARGSSTPPSMIPDDGDSDRINSGPPFGVHVAYGAAGGTLGGSGSLGGAGGSGSSTWDGSGACSGDRKSVV